MKPSVARPSQEAYTIVVWEDERNRDTGSDIYIQRIDNFTGVSEWVTGAYGIDVVKDRFDGIPVCKAENDQRNPRAAYDSLGGVIITWEDYRNDPSNIQAEIYSQRFILATGTADPNWMTDGVPVCASGYHSERPRIVGTGDGAFITWIDYRNDPGPPNSNREVFVQYMKSQTASWPPAPSNWAQDGIMVHTSSTNDQINPELDLDHIWLKDSFGGYTKGVIVVYQDNRHVSNTTGLTIWSVYANRLDADGNQKYIGNNGIPTEIRVAVNNESQEDPVVVTTATGGVWSGGIGAWSHALIAWEDYRAAPITMLADIYTQRLDDLGARNFGLTGLPVCTDPSNQQTPMVVHWATPTVFAPYLCIGWEDHRNNSSSQIDIYSGLVDVLGPGAVINPSGVAGDPVCTAINDQTDLSMDVFRDNGTPSQVHAEVVFVWQDGRNGYLDIYYQNIRMPQWYLVRPIDGFCVSEARGDQSRPEANREVFVFQDGRRMAIPNDDQEDQNIYCQTPGYCVGSKEMDWRDMFAKWTYGKDAANYRFVVDEEEDGSTYVVWDEIRYPFGNWGPNTEYRIVFIQKIDRYGVPRWSNNGVAVNPYLGGTATSALAQFPDVCIDGNGGARVVWQQYNAASLLNECWASHVASTGVAAFVPSFWGAIPGFSYTEPRIVKVLNGVDEAAVATLRLNTLGNYDRYGGRWPVGGFPTPFPITNASISSHVGLEIAYDGFQGSYYLTRDVNGGMLNIAHCPWGSPFTIQTEIPYINFGGYDLDAALATTPGVVTPALFTYSIGSTQPGGTMDVWFGEHTTTLGTYTLNVTMNGPDVYSTQPAIAPDSILGSAGVEGALLVWNTDYLPQGSVIRNHKVETNRVTFLIPWPRLAVNHFPMHFILDDLLPFSTHPDIARVAHAAPSTFPYGVCVWEGGAELGICCPPRPVEIYGQYLCYDLGGPAPGPIWATKEMVAPGPGNYFQYGPTVKTGLPESVSTYWYDTQTGNTGVMGTLLDNLGGAIRWAKRGDEPSRETIALSHEIESIWPNPFDIGIGGVVSVKVRSQDARYARLTLHNMLGREVAVVHDGVINGESIFSIDPGRYNLTAGVYIVRMLSEGKLQTKQLTIVK